MVVWRVELGELDESQFGDVLLGRQKSLQSLGFSGTGGQEPPFGLAISDRRRFRPLLT
jgi:hypothetical protein